MKHFAFFILVIISFLFCSIKPTTTIKILRLNMKADPKSMDPRKGGDTCSLQMQSLFFEGLVKIYPDQSVKLAQAKSYEVSDQIHVVEK